MVTYQVLTEKEIQEDLFRDFQRRQEVTRRLEKTAEGWTVREDRFVEDWGPEEYQILVRCLRHTAASGGLVLGAFSERKLKGFVSVEGAPAGSRGQYLELSSLHVSRELRGQGIGAALFEAARRFAWERGIRRLYISAHPTAETQAFYRAMGCREAEEYQHSQTEHTLPLSAGVRNGAAPPLTSPEKSGTIGNAIGRATACSRLPELHS